MKSLVGARDPRRISFLPASSWVMIVGITALADCLGPNVLNGRTIVTGSPKLR